MSSRRNPVRTKSIVEGEHFDTLLVKHPELKPIVSLATAHPLKFPSALKEATAKELLFDDELDKMMKTEEVFDILPPDAELVRQYILDNL